MLKNKYLLFLLSISLSIFLFVFVSANNVYASPVITSFLLNGNAQNITFNPNNGESTTIEVKANLPVKFTRLYICSVNQICNGTSGNYIRYFTQSDISDTIIKIWNGKKTGDTEIVPAGEYKVMVSMTEGTNSPVTEFGQYSIFVDFSSASGTATSSSSSDTGGDSTSTTAASSTTSTGTQTTKIVTRTIYVSTHSGEEDLSDYNEKPVFEITAGRERAALVGSQIDFNAKYTLLQKYQCAPSFRWSFGDGFDIGGKNVTHTYKYPGEYQVVLNGTCGDYGSISRTVVKISSPNILILNLENDDTEVLNNSNAEINIGNWKIKGGQKDFIFSQDTIISAKNKIVLSKEDLNNSSSSGRISINNSSGMEVAYYIKNKEQQNFVTSVSGSGISVIEAEKLLKEYKEKLVLNGRQNNKIEKIKKDDTIESSNKNISVNESIIQNTPVINSVNSPSANKSFFAKLIDIPVKSIKYFAHRFYDF